MSTTDIDSAKSATSSTFLTALVFNAGVAGAEIAAFTLLRPYFKAIYEPRTYTPPKSKRIQSLSRNILLWPVAVWRSDYKSIMNANGLDAYFFVRFLRMLIKIFLPVWLISWAVLLPLTSVNTQVGNNRGLDQLVFGNVENDKQERYAGHIICVYLFTGWIFYNIKEEMRHFTITRQHHLIDPVHARSVQANTLLITGIPAKYLNQDALFKLFGGLPGGVRRIWINRNLKDLPDIYDRRLEACSKLESAETKLLNTAAKLHAKEAKRRKPRDSRADLRDAESRYASMVPKDQRPTHKLGFLGLFGEKVDSIDWSKEEIRITTEMLEDGRGVIDRALAEESARAREAANPNNKKSPDVKEEGQEKDEFTSADQQDRGEQATDAPQAGKSSREGARAIAGQLVHNVGDKVGAVGRVGGKVGNVAVGVVKSALHHTGRESYPPLNSAFITFNKQIAAHLGMQSLVHHEPYRMSARHIEVSPSDVIWANLGLNPYEMKVRTAISWAATGGLIILWAFPVAFVGAVSNIQSVCSKVTWLGWICRLPQPVPNIISGILPPILLAVLMMLLPIVLRMLAQFEGIPTKTGCELSLMNRFFAFQVLHSFLIVTLSAGIIASLTDLLNNPASIPNLLAANLPKASTFFLTYTILQGLAGTAGGFLQIVPLVIYYVKLFILGSTPRSLYGIRYGKRGLAWGTAWPGVTLLVTIALGYSIISPVINGLACATFFLFYMLYKYLFLWQFDQSDKCDTGGLFLPRAIQHVFVGLYVQQVCLTALFFLARDEELHPSAVPEGALMIVLLAFTAGYQLIINNSYGPLITALPLSLQDKMYVAPEKPAVPENGHGRGNRRRDDTVEMADRERDVEKGPSGDGGDITAVSKNPASVLQKKRVVSEDEYGFSHPAASRPQRTVWIPRDTLGLAEEEERILEEAGVDVSLERAEMSARGKVVITGGPPDMIELEEA